MARTHTRTGRRRVLTYATALVAMIPSAGAGQEVPLVALNPADAVFDVWDELFTAVSSVRELRDGRVLVADRQENRIALVDFTANRSTPVGRAGDGPGEYRGIGWLYALADDSSILTDAMSRRWILLEGAQAVQTIPAESPLARELGPLLSGSDRSGHVLGVAPIQSSARIGRENADSLAVILADRTGPGRDTIAHIRGRGPNGACFYAMRNGRPEYKTTCSRLATEDIALLFPDGWIAVAMTAPYRVDWRSPDGQWTRGSPLPFESIPIDDATKCAILGQQPGLGLAKSCDSNWNAWPNAMPPFLLSPNAATRAVFSPVVLATVDGNLLIRRASTSRRDSTRYDLIDRRAMLIGRIRLSPGETIVGFGSESVYVARPTEDGLQELRRHPWQGVRAR